MRKHHKDQKYNALERRVLRKDQKGEHHMQRKRVTVTRSRDPENEIIAQ